MFNCSCCNPPKTFSQSKSVWRHERKHNPNYKTPEQTRRDEYDSSPTYCLECSQLLTYEQMVTDRDRKYCSQACSATYSHKHHNRPSKKKYTTKECPECSGEVTNNYSTYCSITCNALAKRNSKNGDIEAGLVSFRPTLKKYLIQKRGYRCEICAIDQWTGQPVPLELDHINGDASNNNVNNIRLICPNCHALTPTAKGKNRGRGRKSLGIDRN